jgi:hypothetical protein
MDATPERLAKGDVVMVANPALLDSQQRSGSVRLKDGSEPHCSTSARWLR